MTVPKAAVFDLGKVLLDFDYSIAVQKMLPSCRLPFDQMLRLVNQSPLLHKYESNGISTAEFFAEIQKQSGYCGSILEFRAAFADIFTPIERMVHLHERVRRSNVPTFIFSNTNEIAIEHVRRRFPFFANFDGYIYSYEHSVMKPDVRLYRVVEKMAGASGADILYIDDRPENIAVGQQLGWRAILHETAEATEVKVRESGLLG